MSTQLAMRQYQRQTIMTSSPEQLVDKLYELGIVACNVGDRSKVRRVLVELISGLNFEKGGEIAIGLNDLYQFCMRESIEGDLNNVGKILSGLREAWREGVLKRKAA